jgi:diphthamide biosynthesis protein 2
MPDFEPTCTDAIQQHQLDKQYIPRTIGGLEIPEDLDLSQYTLLYVGDDLNIDLHDGNAQHRLLQILLRCDSPDGPKSIWSYSPEYRRLNTDVLNSPLSYTDSTTLSTVLSRMLRRRYFLLNKAKLATTIAILIGTTSNSYSFRRLLSRTRERIQSTGRTAYTFAVGKLSTSGHKLANFAEIDCFVLISCGESITKFWQMERDDMIVPVLSPAELDVALGFREWDGRYSCDFGDLIRWDKADAQENETQISTQREAEKHEDDACNEDSSSVDDEPFFSMISGKYEQSKAMTTKMNQSVDLGSLPGQGILIEYRSEAAEFLRKREYRGLEANVGETKVQAAVLGKVGIASDYGEKI